MPRIRNACRRRSQGSLNDEAGRHGAGRDRCQVTGVRKALSNARRASENGSQAICPGAGGDRSDESENRSRRSRARQAGKTLLTAITAIYDENALRLSSTASPAESGRCRTALQAKDGCAAVAAQGVARVDDQIELSHHAVVIELGVIRADDGAVDIRNV
jgi:hypothetical protein